MLGESRIRELVREGEEALAYSVHNDDWGEAQYWKARLEAFKTVLEEIKDSNSA